MSNPRAELHQGVKWSMDYDPSTTGFLPRFVVSNPDGESAYYDNALIGIDYAHYKVHSGDTYQAMSYTGTVANGATIDLLISVTGSAKEQHLEWQVACGGNAEVQFWKEVTGSNYGVALPDYNLNDDSDNLSEVSVFQNPTITANGKLWFNFLVPGGTGGNASGGEFRIGTERILRPGRRYRLIAYNRSGNPQPLSVGLQWYEED